MVCLGLSLQAASEINHVYFDAAFTRKLWSLRADGVYIHAHKHTYTFSASLFTNFVHCYFHSVFFSLLSNNGF